MKGYTEIYNLKTEDIDDCIRLINRANVRAYVYPPKNGWVTFVIEDEEAFMFNESIWMCNDGVIMYYVYSEDFGWGFEIYNKQEKIAMFSWSFDEETLEDMDLDDFDDFMFDELHDKDFMKINKKGRLTKLKKVFSDDIKKYNIIEKMMTSGPSTEIEQFSLSSLFIEETGLYYSENISFDFVNNRYCDGYVDYNDEEIEIRKVNFNKRKGLRLLKKAK